tara:strand:- start:329 stop:1378 length:1050 start_codon:yes stop_codon:yes gene_type:complete
MLYLISKLYYYLLKIREHLYDLRLLKQVSFDTPIISIGNITVGGTGKTPMIIYLSQLLTKQNKKHVVVSRGYKKSSWGTIIIQDYNKQFVIDPLVGGDEPVMLAYKLKNIPIIVDENKSRGITLAIKEFSPDLILLDDGFQSLYIKKHTDCVLIDLSLPINKYVLLPKGRLREPLSAIKRSDFLIFIKKIQKNSTIKTKLKPILNQHKIEHFDCDVQSVLYQHNYIHNKLNIVNNTGKIKTPVMAIAGIGNPLPFMNTVDNMFDNIVIKKIMPDHYNYQKNIKKFTRFINTCNRNSTIAIITTLKDYIKIIKLPIIQNKNYDLYILDINFYVENENLFLGKILRERRKR